MKKTISAALFIALSTATFAEEKRHADAHVHGLNHVQMVLSANQLNIDYQMPMVQLNTDKHHDEHDDHDDHQSHRFFGFLEGLFGHDEHEEEAHHDDEHEHDEVVEVENIEQKLQAFKDYDELFTLASSANCALIGFKSELHSVSTESTHKDIELSYQFNCDNPRALDKIEFSAFKHFEIDEIKVEALIDNNAFAQEVTAENNKISWKY